MTSKDHINRRSSMNQPVHWRPPYFKTERSYQCYVRRNSDDLPRSPGKDHGLDNFSFDPAHLKEWQMPAALAIGLPADLHQAARNWEMAGAALCTSIERTQDLSKEALGRAYPDKTHSHLHRRVVRQVSVVTGADTPPVSSSSSPTPSMPEGAVLTHKIPHLPLTHLHLLAAESPPMTPFDSAMARTPVYPSTGPKAVEPDLALVTDQLSPLSSSQDSINSAAAVGFDESSWERYIKTFNIQLADVKEGLNRLKGFARTVDTLSTEYGRDDEVGEGLTAFLEWWGSVKAKIAEYEGRVNCMAEPELERVKMEWQVLRAKEGKDY